ncbi:MAG: RNA polymerase sigma factor [Dorea sp.]
MVESEDVKKAEIDRLYKENVSKVYRTALYYVEDHYVAEEIVQEVFLKLYDNLGDICMESVPAWLITTAKNMAKNYLRDSKWETPMEEVPEQEVPYSSEGLDAQLIEVLRQKECRELHDTIFADLYEKNSRWYEAVTVSYTLDKPQKEVAEKMGISVDTLYSTLYRAKQWIKSTTKNSFTNWMANKKQVPDMTPVFFYQISASESDSFVSI